jgi:predicted HAD superfamily Cof-like phosphohydrolase
MVGDIRARILKFNKTLRDELDEGGDLLFMMNQKPEMTEAAILTELADWFGDIIVYAASEMRKYGIPLDQTLHIIMESNFSKNNPDGTTTYDENGKVMKGVNYWKPEPKISSMLGTYMK